LFITNVSNSSLFYPKFKTVKYELYAIYFLLELTFSRRGDASVDAADADVLCRTGPQTQMAFLCFSLSFLRV
jgi:hypothetical protein